MKMIDPKKSFPILDTIVNENKLVYFDNARGGDITYHGPSCSNVNVFSSHTTRAGIITSKMIRS